MPSVSKAEQSAMAIAEHEPSKLYARNQGMLGMTHSQLHDFASTPRKNLPQRAKGHGTGGGPGPFDEGGKGQT